MKKFLIGCAAAAVIFGMSASESKAANAMAQSNTGCGLGAVLIQNNDTLIAQLAMTLLNGTSGNGTFGITTGTSNCKQATKIVSNELHNFVASNMDNLASDIAMGTGENLTTLAELMNVPVSERDAFNAKLQANFSTIYSAENVDAASVIDGIATVTKG